MHAYNFQNLLKVHLTFQKKRIIVFLVLVKGIKSLGKIVYFTALFPYVILLCILIRGLMLPGSSEGLKYYLTPKWEKLALSKTWTQACTQLFYSIGVCQGALLTMASYNKFRNNVFRDSLIVPIVDCFTSFFSGLVIFSVLGFMAHTKNVDISKVAEKGPALTFIVYPEAISNMPLPTLWAVLFYFMMSIIGFSSQFSIMETVISAVFDQFPSLRKHSVKVRLGICVAWFVMSLPMVTQGGYYLFELVNDFVSGYPLLIAGFLEMISINWIYGYKNFAKDIEMMIGRKPYVFFAVCWNFISPVILIGVTVFNSFEIQPYMPEVLWAEPLGWVIAGSSLSCIPLWMIYYYCRHGGFKLLKTLGRPDRTWGPSQDVDRTGRYEPFDKAVKDTVYFNLGANIESTHM